MKVSIIIPVYNVEKYIIPCLQSVANQTMTEGVECVLIDDKGDDNSMSLAQQFVDGYCGTIQFKVFHHEKNEGLSAARNTGIAAAKGKYLYFLDSDDELTPECIDSLYTLASKYDADMVQGCYIADTPMLCDFWKTMPEYSEDRSYIKRTMLNYDRFPIMAQNRLVKRDIIVNNNLYFKEGIIHEDKHWSFFLAKKINRLAVGCNPIYRYRITLGSITAQKNPEKEKKAIKCILSDACDNIDSFEEGVQKRFIFYNLLSMVFGEYVFLKDEKDFYVELFLNKCSLTEKVLVRLCLTCNSSSWLFEKLVHTIVRLIMKPKMDLLSRIDNKLYVDLNPKIRENFIIPTLRKKLKNRTVSIIASNCVGGCISHTLGLQFNSPFVNLWLYPKDFIKYCSNIEHYINSELSFYTEEQVYQQYGLRLNYPVGRLDDITIFFMHYESEGDAKRKWCERSKRICLDNLCMILTERDGCTKEDLLAFSNLPYHSASLVHKPMKEISSSYYIKGFERLGFVGNTMEYKANHYLGRMYYDDFDYVDFINKIEND